MASIAYVLLNKKLFCRIFLIFRSVFIFALNLTTFVPFPINFVHYTSHAELFSSYATWKERIWSIGKIGPFLTSAV